MLIRLSKKAVDGDLEWERGNWVINKKNINMYLNRGIQKRAKKKFEIHKIFRKTQQSLLIALFYHF